MKSQTCSAEEVKQRVHGLALTLIKDELKEKGEFKTEGQVVSNGTFCDLWQGQLHKGDTVLNVAIKKLRIIVQSDDNDKKVRVHTTSTKPISQILLAL